MRGVVTLVTFMFSLCYGVAVSNKDFAHLITASLLAYLNSVSLVSLVN